MQYALFIYEDESIYGPGKAGPMLKEIIGKHVDFNREIGAARWADHRKVPQVAFKPDWTKYAKAAPIKRNDQMLDALPIGVMHFPGTGIQHNLADKARKLGIPVWKFGGA